MVSHLGSVGGGVSEVFSPLKTLDNGSKVGKVVTLLFPLGMVHLDLSICQVASSVESLLVDSHKSTSSNIQATHILTMEESKYVFQCLC
jgi:hypothetical protein